VPIENFSFAKGGGWQHINATEGVAVHESGYAVAHHLIGRGRDPVVLRRLLPTRSTLF
jgi:hypothetical protein